MRTPYADPCPCLRLVLYVAVSHTAHHHHRLVLDDLRLRADPGASYAVERGAGGSFGGGVGSFLFEQEDEETPERVLTYRTDNDTLVCTVIDSAWASASGVHWCNLTLPRGGGVESGAEGGGGVAAGKRLPPSIRLDATHFDGGCPSERERTYRFVSEGLWLRTGACGEAPMP